MIFEVKSLYWIGDLFKIGKIVKLFFEFIKVLLLDSILYLLLLHNLFFELSILLFDTIENSLYICQNL